MGLMLRIIALLLVAGCATFPPDPETLSEHMQDLHDPAFLSMLCKVEPSTCPDAKRI